MRVQPCRDTQECSRIPRVIPDNAPERHWVPLVIFMTARKCAGSRRLRAPTIMPRTMRTENIFLGSKCYILNWRAFRAPESLNTTGGRLLPFSLCVFRPTPALFSPMNVLSRTIRTVNILMAIDIFIYSHGALWPRGTSPSVRSSLLPFSGHVSP